MQAGQDEFKRNERPTFKIYGWIVEAKGTKLDWKTFSTLILFLKACVDFFFIYEPN